MNTTTLTEVGLAALLADGWVRSRRGNLMRTFGRLRATVFERHGGYYWSVSNGPDVGYSDDPFRTEAEAQAAVTLLLESEVNDGDH